MTSKRLLAVALALTLALAALLPALAEDAAPAPDATQEPAAAEVSPETVVMTVNGKEFTKAQLDESIAALAAYGLETTDDPALILSAGLQQLLAEEFIDAKIAELNFSLTDEEKARCQTTWESQVQAYADSLLTSETPTDEEKAKARQDAETVAVDQGFTLEYLEKSLLTNQTLNELVKDVAVTDEEIQAVYDEYVLADEATYGGEGGFAEYDYMVTYGPMLSQYGMMTYREPYYIPEGIRGITHILLAVDADLLAEYKDALARFEEAQDAADKAAEGDAAETAEPSAEETAAPEATQAPVTQAELDALKAQILASVQPTVDEIMKKLSEGASFDDLIDEYNTDPGMQDAATKANGYNVHKDSSGLDIAFRDASFTGLENIGDISEPVVSQFGVHILCYKRDVPSGPVEFTDALKAQLSAEALGTKQNSAIQQALADWQAAAAITLADGYTLGNP